MTIFIKKNTEFIIEYFLDFSSYQSRSNYFSWVINENYLFSSFYLNHISQLMRHKRGDAFYKIFLGFALYKNKKIK